MFSCRLEIEVGDLLRSEDLFFFNGNTKNMACFDTVDGRNPAPPGMV